MAQPSVSSIRPLREWTGTFEKYWRDKLTRIKERAEQERK
jgi:hypothetical protein